VTLIYIFYHLQPTSHITTLNIVAPWGCL